jgi:2-dehydro-3-deoxygluconokinase
MTTAHRSSVVTFGETMALLRMTEVGSLRHASQLAVGIGGAESNVAIGLQRLGVDASWLGRIGDDPFGARVAREIRAEGVEVRAVVDAEAPTGLMVKERPSAASSAVHYYRAGSAGSRLTSEDIPAAWIEDASLLHVTGITVLLSESARATVHAAINRAEAAGIPVSFDINYRSKLAPPDVAGSVLREVAVRAQQVFGGSDELSLLFSGEDSADSAARLLEAGCREVVRKDGASGATAFDVDGAVHGPGFPIDPLDTVGAGDAFVAGYLSALLEELPVEDRLLRANACGAIACLMPGDWEAAPTRREVEAFLRADGDADPVHR